MVLITGSVIQLPCRCDVLGAIRTAARRRTQTMNIVTEKGFDFLHTIRHIGDNVIVKCSNIPKFCSS